MGLNLKPLITSNPIRIPDLDGKVVAIDAFNVIYQFLKRQLEAPLENYWQIIKENPPVILVDFFIET